MGAGVVGGLDHSLYAAVAETAGDNDAARVVEQAFRALALYVFGADPADVDVYVARHSGVHKGFFDRDV